MGNCGRGCRIFLHFSACVILVAAVVLAAIALGTPNWQQVTVDGSVHEHGLWRDCVSKLDSDDEPTDWLCEFRSPAAEEDETQLIGHDHVIQHWRFTTIILLTITIFPFGFIGVIFGFISACTDCCSYNKCLKGLSVTWTIFSFMATILMAAACIIFFRHGYENEERKIQDGVNIYEQVFGWSYYLAIVSTVAFAVGTIFALIATVLLHVMGSERSEPKETKVWPKYNVNNDTAV